MDEKCRLCLSVGSNIESIFEQKEGEISLSAKIMICTGTLVALEDEFSKFICHFCSDMLDVIYDFRKRTFKALLSQCSSQTAFNDNSDNLGNNEKLEIQNVPVTFDNESSKLSKHNFISSLSEKESDLGIDRVVSEEVVFDEDESLKETFTSRQFQVGCYVPIIEDDPEKEVPLLRRFKCTTCKNVFSTINELDEHWDICEKLVTSEGSNGSLINFHTRQDGINLEDEIDESGNDEDCITIKKKSKTKEFCCETCGQIFKQLWLLTRHKQVKHVCERPFSCPHCPRSFFDKYELKYHQRLHEDVEDFCCSVCGRRFARRSGLRAHMRSHTGEKPYTCGTCGKAFAHLNSLNTHERVHTGERPYKCNYCDRTFAQYSTAKAHEEQHMGGLRLYQCDICDRMFKTEEDLRSHSISHEGNLPYSCIICNKGFKKSLDLKKHNIRVHFDKKPFVCPECSISFMTTSELDTHLSLHSDDSPFTCSFCNRRYRLKSTLRRHVDKHHAHSLPLNSKELVSNSVLEPLSLNMF